MEADVNRIQEHAQVRHIDWRGESFDLKGDTAGHHGKPSRESDRRQRRNVLFLKADAHQRAVE